jgi:serine/threonine-protein kinase
MPAPDTLIDQVFDGRYRVVRKLGTGGMANVCLAEDRAGRSVAIKMLDERHSQDEQFVERFRREAKCGPASHPTSSRSTTAARPGTYYIAMEYLEDAPSRAPDRTRADAARGRIDDAQVSLALRFAHRPGIVTATSSRTTSSSPPTAG